MTLSSLLKQQSNYRILHSVRSTRSQNGSVSSSSFESIVSQLRTNFCRRSRSSAADSAKIGCNIGGAVLRSGNPTVNIPSFKILQNGPIASFSWRSVNIVFPVQLRQYSHN